MFRRVVPHGLIRLRPFVANEHYVSLVPLEESSGNRRRLGHITKQGSSILRFLLVEAAQVTVRSLPEWRSKYSHLMMRRGRKIAKVAMARRLAVRLYWMMRQGWDYQQWVKFGSQGRKPLLKSLVFSRGRFRTIGHSVPTIEPMS